VQKIATGIAMKGAKGKRGRPPKPRGARRSKNRTFRIRENLDDYLIGKAHETGRSVSEEIESRISRSFYMDALLEYYVGDAAPLLNAITTAVTFSLMSNQSGADRYRMMQAAVGYIIAAFGSKETATAETREKVSDVRWPPLSGKPEGHELQGLITADWLLSNLNPERLAEQIAEMDEISGAFPQGLRDRVSHMYRTAEELRTQGRMEKAYQALQEAIERAQGRGRPREFLMLPDRERGKGNWYAVLSVKDPQTGKRKVQFRSLPDCKGKREAQIECGNRRIRTANQGS